MTRIKLASIFTKDIILQRNKPIPVWGEGCDGTIIDVTIASNHAQCIVRNQSWSVTLPAMEACCKQLITLTATDPKDGTREDIIIENVSVGEVWIAGGQSNMEFLYRYDIEKIPADKIEEDEELRFFDVPKVSYEGQLEMGHYDDYGFWRTWNSENSEWFSAVGLYFGQELRRKLGVPVGIIGCNWGGSSAAAWTSPEYMGADPQLKKVVEEYLEGLNTLDRTTYIKATDYMTAKDPSEERKFLDLFMMGKKFSEVLTARGNSQTEEEVQYSMMSMKVGPRSFRRPYGLYQMMLSTILPYEIRGVLWYQGEEDEISRSEFYDISLKGVIDTFRNHRSELPFLIVQLPPFEGNAFSLARKYPTIRKLQQKVSETMPNVWCACITDAGDRNNIHPRRKKPVGERLGWLALKHTYGMDLEADSPRFVKGVKEGETVILHFENVADGLHTTDDKATGIELYGEGLRLSPDITLEKDTVILTDESLISITDITVKYAADNYFEVNLFNSAGLPVFPFEVKI
jgi:sialate O-acetylesterase